MKNYLQNRTRAMKWINSEKRTFSEGIAILKDAGFKPGVVSVLERHGSGRYESEERLIYHMRQFIKAYADESAREDTDLTLGVVEGNQLQPDQENVDKKKIPSMFAEQTEEKLEAGEFPEPIDKLIRRYREAYVERDRLRLYMADLPETNDDETMEKRRRISDRAKELSDLMDEIYPKYAAYITEGKLPEDTENSEGGKILEEGEKSSDSQDDNPDKQQLQKQRKSIATKILRARNMLKYQKETKQDRENPLTDPVKVAKYQSKIDSLSKELEDIDMQIAKLG